MGTKEMTTRVRLTHWAGVMQARSKSGQSVRRWCRDNGVNEKTYYYWQRKLREAACEHLAENASTQPSTGLIIPGFAEVKLSEPPRASTDIQGELRVEIGRIKLSASSDYPPEHVAEILKRLDLSC